jgi:hypothetical protein
VCTRQAVWLTAVSNTGFKVMPGDPGCERLLLEAYISVKALAQGSRVEARARPASSKAVEQSNEVRGLPVPSLCPFWMCSALAVLDCQSA